MSDTRRCRYLLRELSKSTNEDYTSYLCKVKEVNGYTCTVKRVISGIEVENVRLNAMVDDEKGLLVIPAANSYVMVTHIDMSNAYVSQYSEIDKMYLNIGETELEATKEGVKINGGNNGGLVKIQEMTNKLNELISTFNNHVHSGVVISVSGGSGAPAIGAPGNSAPPTKTALTLNKGDYENTKVQH